MLGLTKNVLRTVTLDYGPRRKLRLANLGQCLKSAYSIYINPADGTKASTVKIRVRARVGTSALFHVLSVISASLSALRLLHERFTSGGTVGYSGESWTLN